jgi:flagellin-like protein
MKMNKLRKNAKALSPIFATLILIAIAVIAGIIVYMFTSGTLSAMMGGGSAGQEKMAIQAVAGNVTADTNGDNLFIWAQSTGGGNIIVDTVIVKDSAANVVGTITGDPATDVITASVTHLSWAFSGLVEGNTYTVTLVSKAGGSFVSPSFKSGA